MTGRIIPQSFDRNTDLNLMLTKSRDAKLGKLPLPPGDSYGSLKWGMSPMEKES